MFKKMSVLLAISMLIPGIAFGGSRGEKMNRGNKDGTSKKPVIEDITGYKDCKVLDADINKYYKGSCKDGLANGKGIAKGRDTFVGEFSKGQKLNGTYIWREGTTYTGTFVNDLRNGYGEETFKGGSCKGNHKDNELDGYAECYYASGQVYKGYFSNGKKVNGNPEKLADINRSEDTKNQEPSATLEQIDDYGAFKFKGLNDYCTVFRLFSSKNREYDLDRTAEFLRGFAYNNYKSADEFDKNDFYVKAKDYFHKQLKTCGQFSDQFTLNIHYKYNKDDYNFYYKELRVAYTKDMAVNPKWADFVNARENPEVPTIITNAMNGMFKPLVIGETGVTPIMMPDVFNVTNSLNEAFEELGLRSYKYGFIINFYIRSAPYATVMNPDVEKVKMLRSESNGGNIDAKIDFVFLRSGMGVGNGYVLSFYAIPKYIKFIDKRTQKVIYETKCAPSSNSW